MEQRIGLVHFRIDPEDDDFWRENDGYGEDQRSLEEKSKKNFMKNVDPEVFYNRRGDHYHSQK